ncbi:MAG: hypothetical protein OEN20_01720 [Gammaproteobacteria bacterium]|nr:hypothetical protein [Gammaproteobacteria bacterium]
MRNTPAVRRRWLVSAICGLSVVAVGLLALYYIELTTVQRDYFLQRHGTLEDVIPQAQEITADDHILQNVSLVSSSGLTVDLRLMRPVDSGERAHPTLLLIGGQRTGKRAVDLLERPGDLAFAAIDYPYDGPQRMPGFWQMAGALLDVQRATIDTPPAVWLAVDWLIGQPWVDPQRIELVGISFGVPFAAAAGAIDTRISRIWLIQGGADNTSWAEHNLREKIASDFGRRTVAKLVLLFIYAESFDTLRWMREIAPRPIIVVSARDDERVRSGSALADVTPAETAEIIWTEGRHIRGSRRDELQTLFDIFRDRLQSAPP